MLVKNRAQTGRIGEDLAAEHLERQGYQIIDRNWRCSLGELDIVAFAGGLTVAVEVKTRRSARFGPPLEAITEEKLARLRLLAVEWMRAHDRRGRIRLDAIGIELKPEGRARIQHVEAMS